MWADQGKTGRGFRISIHPQFPSSSRELAQEHSCLRVLVNYHEHCPSPYSTCTREAKDGPPNPLVPSHQGITPSSCACSGSRPPSAPLWATDVTPFSLSRSSRCIHLCSHQYVTPPLLVLSPLQSPTSLDRRNENPIVLRGSLWC